MYEIKYKLTDDDIKRVNKKVLQTYFILYAIVAAVSIAVGITGTVLGVSPSITVLGIILIVLGAILAVCTILLAVSPKNLVKSVLLPDNDLERTIVFGDKNITVSAEGQSDIVFGYGEVTNVKTNAVGLILYIGKDGVLAVPNSDKALVAEIAEFVKTARSQKPVPAQAEEAPAPEAPQEQSTPQAGETDNDAE